MRALRTMPNLSLPSPLARLRRMPFWAQAAVACALFAVAGIAVLDDYGVFWDETDHRRIAVTHADYIATGDISSISQDHDIAHRYYGMALDIPLLLVERAFGLRDTRDIYLTRHLIMYLFFIAGGFACGMLAYRMLGSRWVALLAMLMFLLHPRLYAHSFFNVRDVPFAAMLLIALYLTHRAFRRDTLGAFLICGIVLGLAINMRPFGLMLLPMILAMRGLDLWQAGRGERRRILTTGAALLAATLATAYITHPYYWENPLRFIEGLRVLSQHPFVTNNLFMGEIYRSDANPWNYIPVWFAITAPPFALLLGALGAAAVCWQTITRPLAALRDRETRFGALTLACFALPIVVVIALQSNTHHGWRHMYFLWGPFCLLAAIGLRAIASARMEGGIWKVGSRLPGWVRGGYRLHMARRALAYGVAIFGLTTTLTAIAALHPHQQVYFNALTDTKTPGALGERYDMDYWWMAQLQLLEYLLAHYPDDTLRVWPDIWTPRLLPQEDRDRVIVSGNPHAADFYLLRGEVARRFRPLIRNATWETSIYLHPRIDPRNILDQPPIHSIRAYGSVVASIAAKSDVVDAYRAAYDDVAANGTPLARSDFDIYAYDDALYYLNANCDPPPSSAAAPRIFLHIIPADLADLPADSREFGFENRDFRLDAQAAFFDGKCIDRQPLPDYPIARIRTGQNATTRGGDEWRVDINLAARAVYDRILAGDYGPPVAQSHFDLYLRGNALTYLKEPCAQGDTDARFFLHIIPVDLADLPADSRDRGFDNMDFHFADHGALAGDKCVATLELPEYAIERIRTGQFVSGEGRLWGAEFPAAR